jgi:hypothetical protein
MFCPPHSCGIRSESNRLESEIYPPRPRPPTLALQFRNFFIPWCSTAAPALDFSFYNIRGTGARWPSRRSPAVPRLGRRIRSLPARQRLQTGDDGQSGRAQQALPGICHVRRTTRAACNSSSTLRAVERASRRRSPRVAPGAHARFLRPVCRRRTWVRSIPWACGR